MEDAIVRFVNNLNKHAERGLERKHNIKYDNDSSSESESDQNQKIDTEKLQIHHINNMQEILDKSISTVDHELEKTNNKLEELNNCLMYMQKNTTDKLEEIDKSIVEMQEILDIKLEKKRSDNDFIIFLLGFFACLFFVFSVMYILK
jgi:Fe2+ transport system protein B